MSQQSQTAISTSSVIGAITRNPEGLLLLAAGAALLMRKSGSMFTAKAGGEALRSAASSATEYASGVAEKAVDTMGAAASTAQGYASQARKAVGERSERVVNSTQSAMQGSLDRIVQDQPLMIAVAGLAAGAVLAAAFPATEFEKSTLGPVGEQVTEAAGRVGDQVKEAAFHAADTLKNAAEERGLNADGLKDVATEVGKSFSDAFKGDADQSKDRK